MENNTGLPRHVAIIMDGNGRWAENHDLSRLDGHRAGVRNVRPIIRHLAKLGIGYVTLYTFSTENWNRPEDEVNGLMNLLQAIMGEEARELHRNNVVIHHFGTTGGLSQDLVKSLSRAVRLTRKNTGIHLGMAFNYGGRMEIVDAVREIIRKDVPADAVNEDTFGGYLYTAGFPDADLVIRTSGEYRTSNFLIWQAAYAEYYFTPVLWPDFNEAELDKALQAYGRRKRRFGGLQPGDEC